MALMLALQPRNQREEFDRYDQQQSLNKGFVWDITLLNINHKGNSPLEAYSSLSR